MTCLGLAKVSTGPTMRTPVIIGRQSKQDPRDHAYQVASLNTCQNSAEKQKRYNKDLLNAGPAG